MNGGSAQSGGSSAGAPESGSSAGASESGGSSSDGDVVTWSEHIAPIVYRECVGCHREGGIAAFSLESYAEARAVMRPMADATRERIMPPMPVDNSGACNTYSNARWLDDAEIALFQAWADADGPEGDLSRAPELPPAPGDLDRVDVSLDMGFEYTPNDEAPDDYRCFIVDPGLTSNAFLTGYQVFPGDARVVHHVIVYAPADEEALAEAELLDAEDPARGYTCFGGPGVSAAPRVLWAPGAGVIEMPRDTGVPLVAGHKLVMQIHYNVSAGTFPDRTRVDLRLADRVARPAEYLAVANPEMMVPPRQRLATTTITIPHREQEVTVWGVLPHMHTLGRTLRLDARTAQADADTCLVDVPRWNFHWQNAWWYDAPLSLEQVRSVTLTCGYDTSSRTLPVVWGEGTMDEMCLTYLYVTLP